MGLDIVDEAWRGAAMSKSLVAIAAVILVTLLSSPASAKVRLGPLGGLFNFTRLFSTGGLQRARVARHHRSRNAALRSPDSRNSEARGPDIGSATDSGRQLSNPAQRAQIVAAAALAGWHGGRTANGWWRHSDGSYGWVGPLFWPFANYDVYDYAIRGDGTGFWDYGYPDIYAGIFAPYDRDDLASYVASGQPGRKQRGAPPLQQFCGEDSGNAGLPMDQIQKAVQPTEAQRAALDDLTNASVEAARMIRASCPTQTALTAPDRLAAMQRRIEAMIKAQATVQEPLGKLYQLLDDEQKARMNALAHGRRNNAPAQGCRVESSAALQWPADEIESTLRPNDTQRAALEALRRATIRAVEILTYECRPEEATTPLDRLDVVDRRLYAIQHALNLVSSALDDFYATLSDEQKGQFEAIGPKRTA
ncbi:MAG: Spy/CpxP family protein refolding chaperone [Bradyrhizobium sp.]|nr:Spy/CpxP family protein refolding chaperone [Bradyrhizobium sp.]